jgi:hypothetical protein
MPNPLKQLTAFDFYCDSFEELPAKMKEEVGYEVRPVDIWSINISQFDIDRLHVTLTILYWKDKSLQLGSFFINAPFSRGYKDFLAICKYIDGDFSLVNI